MEPQTIQSLSAPRAEFHKPPPSAEPIRTPGYELRPGFIAMVREQSFSGTDSENPYHHLREFEMLCSCLKIKGMTQETLKWKLFPFSLTDRAKQWYTHSVGSMHGDWDVLQDKFCLAFFPLSRIAALRLELLSFQQSEKESLGAAWARFSLLMKSGPNLSLPEHVLLQHFCLGLTKEAALYLDITSGGSFAHKTPAEGREILDLILENTSFFEATTEPTPEESTSRPEEISTVESEPIHSPSVDSAVETST
jgi:hypothetical protein